MVESVFWDYQASYAADFGDVSHKQFRCMARIKPNQTEGFEGFSILPPIRVVTAGVDGKNLNERIVINRLEYAYGTSWQRTEWVEPEVTATQNAKGKCQPL